MRIQQYGTKAYNFIRTPTAQDARINILEGSVRSGKTVAMIPKVLQIINGPLGQSIGVITGVSKDTIYDNVLRDLFDVVGVKNYNYNRQTGDLSLFGAQCKVIGAKDEGSEKYIRGKTIGWAYCDELSLMPETFFKQLLNRMSFKGAKLYGTTNPDSPYHYLYTDYISDEQKIAAGMVKVLHFNLEDNPNLDDEYMSFIRSAYSGLWYKRMILGLWVLADGAIYDMFDSNKNVIETMPNFEREWVSCDYGTSNPTVFLHQGIANKTFYTAKEYWYDGRASGKQKTDKEYADDLLKFMDGKKLTFIVDPSAASFIAECRKRGMRVKAADNKVLDGIRFVSSVLANNQYYIHKSCTHTIEEKSAYIWDAKAQKLGEDKPLKQNDHASDAERYGLFTNRRLLGGQAMSVY